MEIEGIDKVSKDALKKLTFLNYSGVRYFVYAMMAGFFCAIGMAFAYSCSGPLYDSSYFQSTYKTILGISFALSFTLIVFAGAELFTGNVFVMAMFAPQTSSSITWSGFFNNLIPVIIGNYIGGALFVAAAYWFVSSEPLVTPNSNSKGQNSRI